VSLRCAARAAPASSELTICAKSLTKKRARVYQLDIAAAARSDRVRDADFSLTGRGFRDITPRVSPTAQLARVGASPIATPLAPASAARSTIAFPIPDIPSQATDPGSHARMCAHSVPISVALESRDFAC
jgi:hypothetical protein